MIIYQNPLSLQKFFIFIFISNTTFQPFEKKAQIPRKISSCAMFSEGDENGDGEILPSEWRNFWEQVRGNGYSEEDIAEELQQLMRGGVWVDFLDDRSVSVNSRSAPQKEKTDATIAENVKRSNHLRFCSTHVPLVFRVPPAKRLDPDMLRQVATVSTRTKRV